MDPTPRQPDEALHIGPARHHQCQAAAGSLLVVDEGQVILDLPPRWIDAQMLSPRHRIEAGCCHVLEEGGWITLTAPRGASLRLVAERSRDESLLALLLARVRWLRTLENRLLAAGAEALRLRLERREN
ncbi:MAG: hypothetical protein JNK97_17320 [Zoogloea sp.]|jgi:hypothetical protein|nr:hypothetical protein [Zoogloea sp.]